MKRALKKTPVSTWLEPTIAYTVIVLLVIALCLRPRQLFLWAVVAFSVILLVATKHHRRQKHIHADTYIEYGLVLLAALIVVGSAAFKH
jgi:hypothetical protein